MASIKPYFDTRIARKDGTYPLKLSVSHKGDTVLISLRIYLLPECWDPNKEEVIKDKRKAVYNDTLRRRMILAENVILKLGETGELGRLTASGLKKRIEAGENPEPILTEESRPLIRDVFLQFIDTCKTNGTKTIYGHTLERLGKFADLDTLTFEEVDTAWLRRFEAVLNETNKVNTVALHLRNLRAVFNRAIDEEVISQGVYPFRRFRIAKESTAKRSLSVEELRRLRDYPCEEWQEKWRDMFMLIFYLIGINTVDLMGLTEVRNGRIEYRRAKTHRLYSIRVEPEAQAILEKYRGADHLLDFADRYADHGDFRRRMNAALKKLGPVEWVANRSKTAPKKNKKQVTPLFSGITSYWARHTWATIAASLDIPKETIAAALGHGGNTTTDIYIDFDRRKVDEANRRVIDFLNGQ